MADGSRIEWTEATWNPLRGCSRVSAGCQRCYAERMAARFAAEGQPYEGLIHPSTHGWNGKVRLVPEVLKQPVRWQRPRQIFVNSMSDLFHESVSDEWIDTIFGIMWACLYNRHEHPGHVFQILTKRAARMRDYLMQDRRRQWADAAVHHGGGLDPDGIFDQTMELSKMGPHPRIWLGVSVENQAAADERIPLLLETPAAVRWLSCEPLLGPINFRWVHYAHQASGQTYREYLNTQGAINQYEALRKIDWIVVGGESGPGARPMHPDWARTLRDQCAAAGVPYFFKQWGDWLPVDTPSDEECFADDGSDRQLTGRLVIGHAGDHPVARIGKKRAGRLLDGVLHDAYPEVSRG